MKNNQKLPPLIVILGPTASGKTGLSLKLAKKYNGEIISADSRQIYKGMDIGTDKIKFKKTGKQENTDKVEDPQRQSLRDIKTILSPVIAEKIPHYMIDVINPDEEFSVAEFKENSLKIIKGVHKRGKIPFLVGGTGLYIQSIVENLSIPKVLPNRVIRNELSVKSNVELSRILKKLDPKSADKLDPNNRRRLIRAIEVCKISGKPFSEQTAKGSLLFNILQIGIKTDREKLYKKIDKRIDEMIKEGLVDETKKLIKKYPSDLPSMSGIGYKEILEYLNNNITLKGTVQKIKFRTHHYAKRQMTWFKRDGNINWVDSRIEAENLIKDFLLI